MRDRRLVYVILAAVALVVLFLVFRPGNDEEASPTTTMITTTPTAEPAPTESQPRTTTPTVTLVVGKRWRVDARDEKLDRLTVESGTEVRLVVIADVEDEVHVHGYDLMADVAPGAPGVIAFTANIPGRFEIELEDRGREIAQLTVEP